MKPFKAQCNEIRRKPYFRTKYDKKTKESVQYEVKPLFCEEQIWFEPSLKPDYFVGHCSHPLHNPVYRKV